jgi:hypothetical protein
VLHLLAKERLFDHLNAGGLINVDVACRRCNEAYISEQLSLQLGEEVKQEHRHNSDCIADVAIVGPDRMVALEVLASSRTKSGTRPEPWFEFKANAVLSAAKAGKWQGGSEAGIPGNCPVILSLLCIRSDRQGSCASCKEEIAANNAIRESKLKEKEEKLRVWKETQESQDVQEMSSKAQWDDYQQLSSQTQATKDREERAVIEKNREEEKIKRKREVLVRGGKTNEVDIFVDWKEEGLRTVMGFGKFKKRTFWQVFCLEHDYWSFYCLEQKSARIPEMRRFLTWLRFWDDLDGLYERLIVSELGSFISWKNEGEDLEVDFGKHKGKTYWQLFSEEIEYVEWLAEEQMVERKQKKWRGIKIGFVEWVEGFFGDFEDSLDTHTQWCIGSNGNKFTSNEDELIYELIPKEDAYWVQNAERRKDMHGFGPYDHR